MDDENTNKNILKSNIKYNIRRDLNSLVGFFFFFFFLGKVKYRDKIMKLKGKLKGRFY